MRPRSLLLLVSSAVIASAVACSSTKIRTTSSSTTAPTDGESASEEDGSSAGSDLNDSGKSADAAGDGATSHDHDHEAGASCIAKRVTSSKDCSEDCDVHLLLPNSDYYCSYQCALDADCAVLGSDHICPATIGACVPRCTSSASCKAAGFLRCDVDAGAGGVGGCDTQ